MYKTIILEDNESKWFFDGISASSMVVNDASGNFLGVSLTGNREYLVSYIPDKDDGIFDIVLYAKMDIAAVEEGE